MKQEITRIKAGAEKLITEAELDRKKAYEKAHDETELASIRAKLTGARRGVRNGNASEELVIGLQEELESAQRGLHIARLVFDYLRAVETIDFCFQDDSELQRHFCQKQSKASARMKKAELIFGLIEKGASVPTEQP
jgi:hypothetical protein